MVPNFWCSEDYFRWAGLEERMEANICTVFDDDIPVFPSFRVGTGFIPGESWSDFFGMEDVPGFRREFLDYQFIYNPRHFLGTGRADKSGFRKNVSRLREGLGKDNLIYRKMLEDDQKAVLWVFEKWLQDRTGGTDEIHDSTTLVEALYSIPTNARVLIYRGEMIGFNVWDENYKYINFRYSFGRDIPYLSEYLRWAFYTDWDIIASRKMVNDGGSLDSPSLYKFKERLGPVEIQKIYSIRKEI